MTRKGIGVGEVGESLTEMPSLRGGESSLYLVVTERPVDHIVKEGHPSLTLRLLLSRFYPFISPRLSPRKENVERKTR